MLLWLFTSSTMEGKIREALMKYTEKEREEIFSIMSLPEETSYSQKEEKRFDALVARARRHGIGAPDVRRGIRVFARAYFWFPWEYVGPTVWDERTVQARVRAALHVQTTHKRRNIRTEQDACVRRYALPKDVRVLFSILHAVTLMQDDRKMINAQVCYYLYHDIFSVLAKQFHVTQAHIQYLDIDLLQQYVQTGDRAALRDALKAREDFFVVLRDDTTRVVHYGKESKQYLKKIGIVLEVTQNATEVRGVTAHPGVVRGPVRIVHTSSDRKKFPEGSILVTGMTTPDFVPLMKRTAAIVTDEGGITSHAALVARELGKPCIVGTRNATRVFKDGDDVTVDANVGVVKKIT
ncbi:hypothetical protein HY624_01895 [Candidatus Uhrbacteria bacterium]|nr:hypothetical protein [Candidatus Uhrbacteria bacterium]